MTAIAFSPAIGPVLIDVVVSERHASDLEITEIPVESGARITDHAFALPKKVTLDIVTGNAAATYNALVAFQETRIPFTLVTGLRVYNNMLIKRLDPVRDAKFSSVLSSICDLQEIIIVGTAHVADADGQEIETGEAGGTNSTKAARLSPETAGDQTTADRVTTTTQRGDTGTTSTTDSSILHQMFGD